MPDVLSLGGYIFHDYGVPDRMMGGGKQAMCVHKLPGGKRVIDTLGPDEADVTWSGQLYGDDAYSDALNLDGMRASGNVVPLQWGGQSRQVIVSSFIYQVRRFPVWVEYQISCTVYTSSGTGGFVGAVASSFDVLIAGDLATAAGIGP